MIAARLSQGDGSVSRFSGRCKMLRASRVLLVFSLLSVAAFAADRVGGVQSAAGGIMLRAVLAQSLSVSADPQAECLIPLLVPLLSAISL